MKQLLVAVTLAVFLFGCAKRSQDRTEGSYSAVEIGGRVEQTAVTEARSDFLTPVAVSPMLGRNFVPADFRAGASRVALLSEELWRQSFDSRIDVLGQTIRVGRDDVTIVGIVPSTPKLEGGKRVWVAMPSVDNP